MNPHGLQSKVNNLWEQFLVGDCLQAGPYPVALRLVDLPIIRPVQKLELAEDSTGRLPIAAYMAELKGQRADGSRYDVKVKGDDRYGLPYGSDGDIFFALFKLADGLSEPDRSHLFTTGEFRDPTVGMIARAMGRPMNGETSRRIREALHRLAHLRIEMHVSQPAHDVGVALLSGSSSSGDRDGNVAPLEPDGGPVPRPRKGVDTVGVLHVLEYAVSRTYDRRQEGEDWIAHLQINPVWLREVAGGWAAWMNVDEYVALRSPIAKRLYQLFAGEAARGVQGPWTFRLSELQERCGAVGVGRRPAAVRLSVQEATRELITHEILADGESEKLRHGQYAFTFTPGPQLRIAALLRGVGALDVRELRVQRMLLRYFGVTREAADEVLAERPNRVHDALQYLLYIRDTDHTRVKRSWSAYLLKLVNGDANLAGDVKYQHWLSRRRYQSLKLSGADKLIPLARASVLDHSVQDASGVSPVPRVPHIDAARTVPITVDASNLWNQVRSQSAARYPATHVAYVEDLTAFDLIGDTLTCVTSSGFTLRMLVNAGVEPIEAALRTATGGAVGVLRLEVFEPVRHVRHEK